MSAEHISAAPHEGQAAQLWTELLQAQRQAVSQYVRLVADLEETQRQRDAALAERDRLRADAAVVADLMTDKHNRYVALRAAAREFLAVLDGTQFSAVALKGPELDELRRLCH